MGGLELSNDPESYGGCTVATGRVPMPERSKVMIQTKRDTLVFQVGIGRRANDLPL